MVCFGLRSTLLFSIACFSVAAAEAGPEKAQSYCDAPWQAFTPTNSAQPYRPLIAFEPEHRFLHGGRAPGDVKVDFTAQQYDIRVGGRLIHGVPIWAAAPGAETAAYIFDENGQRCRIRPQDFENPSFRAVWGYAPGRIELDFGDHFKSRVTSRLDYTTASPARPDGAPFGGAPCQSTNLHTHGLLVSPYKDEAKKLYGDYVLDLASPQPGDQCGGSGQHVHNVADALNYDIAIPPHRPDPAIPNQALESGYHPSGLFWFHPHPHGYSAKQLSGGTSGLITVGNADDHPSAPGAAPVKTNLRLMLIRDMQIQKNADKGDYVFVASSDPALCAPSDNSRDTTLWPDGECNGGGDASWVFTVNGVQKPEIAQDLRRDEAEVWRIANGSPSASYRLAIIPLDEVTNKLASNQVHPIDFRILSKDGVAAAQESEAKEMLLMPGSRVTIELDRRLEGGAFALVSLGVYSGGDNWPAVVLATVKWPQAAKAAASAEPQGAAAMRPQAAAPTGTKKFDLTSRGPTIVRSLAKAGTKAGSLAAACEPLDGNERVILFVKNPNYGDGDGYRNADLFGLVAGLRAPPAHEGEPTPADYGAYRFFRRDNADQALADTTVVRLDEVKSASEAKFKSDGSHNFTPAFAAFPEFGNICVRRSRSVEDAETWVIENWTNEFHNFHIHQSRFSIGEASQLHNYAYFRFPCSDPATMDKCSSQNQSLKSDGIIEAFYQDKTGANGHAALGEDLHDSVPIPRGSDNCDGSIDKADCAPGRITVRIPFNRKEQVGTFVYHCHILEHEDRGMMGLVQVIDPDAPETPHAHLGR